jgi:hypothetical protein
MIDKTEVEPFHGQSNMYFGGGLTSVTSGLDGLNPCIGLASWWAASSSDPNSQRSYRFKRDSYDNQGQVHGDWATVFSVVHGPRHFATNAMTRLISHRYNSTSPYSQSDPTMGSYIQGNTRMPSSGPVYAFVTCGRTQTWGTVKTAKFRFLYAVTGADQDWTP